MTDSKTQPPSSMQPGRFGLLLLLHGLCLGLAAFPCWVLLGADQPVLALGKANQLALWPLAGLALGVQLVVCVLAWRRPSLGWRNLTQSGLRPGVITIWILGSIAYFWINPTYSWNGLVQCWSITALVAGVLSGVSSRLPGIERRPACLSPGSNRHRTAPACCRR